MSSHAHVVPPQSGTRTLYGKRVLVTRARAQAHDLVARLEALGAIPIVFSVIHIVPPTDNYAALDTALRQLDTFDWVVFTSANGVVHVWERLTALSMDGTALASVQAAAIGPATSAALSARGVHPAVVPERSVAEALLDAMPHPAGQRFLLPCADLARDTLRVGLQAAGAEVVAVPAYSTVHMAPSPEALAAVHAGVDILTFTSSSTVRNFIEQVGLATAQALAAQARVVTIGPITAATARACGLRVDVVATEYTLAGLCEALQTA